MAKLVINLLGSPSIKLDDKPLEAETYKATALLAYLAVNHGEHTRLELATLLWTELDKDKALAALRTTLWKLKRAGLENWLEIRRGSVFLNIDESIEVDILNFQNLIAQCETHGHHPSKVCPACLPPLAEATNLYHGDFMKGFSLRDAAEFDNWQTLNDEILRQEIRQTLEKLVRGHRAQGEVEQAIHFARRLITHDRFNEDIYRQIMILYTSTGQRTEAIQQYRELAKLLHRDGMEPQPETTQLYHRVLNEKTERILSGQELETPIFLATDVENADDMWGNYHGQMVSTMARYHAIIKECANQFGGYLVKQADDTSIIFFDHGQPVHCVLAIHKRLMRTTWTVNSIPRIRIALNAVEHRQTVMEEYTTDIYRTRRLLSAGWGGQVLMTTQVLNSVELPPHVQVHDLGIHMLKDLGEPLRIYQLSHSDLPSREFPPLQTLSGYRQNLPAYPTLFIDREMEQADLANLLLNENCRLLTLVGPGGVGKTRLALQVAAQQIDNFPDGVYFVPVTVPKTPELIPSVLAEIFKFTFFEQKNPQELIINFLREKNLLLIIDNFEHLIDGAEALWNLLSDAPRVKMIVTSRERLNLHQEWIYEVQGMAFPSGPEAPETLEQYSAVQLFIQNARRLLTGFSPTPDDLAAITEICQMVNGMPLAIELATAWVRTLSCQEIAKEINKSVDFLNTSMRDIPARHRSLRAVFEHSWNLLSEEGRRTFRKLSVFRCGFTADAALQIAKTSPILLASFVDRSLLRRISHDRFEIMETIRHFAIQKLLENKPDFDKTRALHCAYYADLLEQNLNPLMSADQGRSIEQIRTEIENIRVAWRWAVETENWAILAKSMSALMVYKEIVGHYADGREIFQMALDKLLSSATPQREWLEANLKVRLGWMVFCTGEHAAGLQHLQEGLESFSKSGSTLEVAITLYLLAKANERLNRPQIAIEQASKSLEVFRDPGYADLRLVRSLLAHTLEVYGLGLIRLEQVRESKAVLQESLHIHQQLGQRYGSVHVLDALGKVAVAEGDLSGALSLRLQALKIARGFGNQYSIAILLNNLADIYTKLNDLDKSMRYQQESIELSRDIGHRWLTAIGYNNLAFINLKFYADPNEAVRLYKESLSLFSDIEDQRGVIFTLHDLGVATLEARQPKSSRRYFHEALDHAHQLGEPELQLYVLSSLATAYARLGQPAYACELSQLVLAHPESSAEAKQRATSLMDEVDLELTAAQIEAASLRGQSAGLAQVVSELLNAA